MTVFSPAKRAPHRAGRSGAAALLLTLIVLPCAPGRAAAVEPVVMRSGSWLGACDNGGDCSLFGFSEDDVATLILRLPRRGEPSGALIVRFDRASAQPDNVRLQAGRRGASVVVPLPVAEADSARGVLAPAALRVLLPALRQSGRLLLSGPGRSGLRDMLRLKGPAAVLDWVSRQQRVAPVLPPRWPAAPPPDPTAPPPDQVPPVAVASLPAVRACIAQEPGRSADATPLSGRAVLWRIPCGSGNFSQDSLFVVAERGDAAVAAFSSPPQFPVRASGVLVNAEIEAPDVLVATEPSRGLNDCGDVRRYRWDGRRFRLERAQLMPACHGLAVEDWPVVYRTAPPT